MVTLTDKAKSYMKSVLMNGDKVSLAVKGGGCSGFQYVWGLMTDHPDVKWSEPIEEVLVVDPLAPFCGTLSRRVSPSSNASA